MERMALTAEVRKPGKGLARGMRSSGKVPAVLYGKAVPSLPISVDRKQLEAAVKTKAGMNVLIDLAVQGGDSGLALIRDYQADPFRREFTHVDFQAIRLTDKLEVEVPLILLGTPVGVKEGGVAEQLRRTIHIRALPTAIPDKFELDISELAIGDSLHLSDVKFPEGVESSQVANCAIVTIVPPMKEEAPAVVPAEGVAVAEGEAPAEGVAPAEGAASAEGAAPAKGTAPTKGSVPAEGAALAAKGKGRGER